MNIQNLIASGNTEQALIELCKYTNDGALLLSRFNANKRQFNMGMLENDTYQRANTQINYAALELASKITPSVSVNITNVTINFSSEKTFESSIESMPLDTLVAEVTKEFKGKPAMEAWLPLKNDYESYELLGRAFAPGYLSELKRKLVELYKVYWSDAKTEKDAQVKTAVDAIYKSLTKAESEAELKQVMVDLDIFAYENKGYERGIIRATSEMAETLEGNKMKLYREYRQDSYKSELAKIKAELTEISNRILKSLEGK